MIEKYISANPELIRHLRTHFRYPRVLSYVILYLLTLLSLYALIYFTMSMGRANSFEMTVYSKIIYVSTMGLEYMLYFYVGTYLISNSLAQEKEKATFDFIRLTVIDRKVIAVGKLLGAPVFLSFLLLITFPFVAASAYYSGIDLLHFMIVQFNLVTYGLLFHTLGLFCSVSIPKSSSANAMAMSLPLLITTTTLSLDGRAANPFYNLFSVLGNTPFRGNNFNFWGSHLPDFLVIGFIIFYLVGWFMIGLIRKLDAESNHNLSKKQAVSFLAGTELIITGLMWYKLSEGSQSSLTIFYILSFILLVILTSILSPTRDDIFIYLNKAEKKNSFWEPKSPLFNIIILLNGIVLVTGLLSSFTAVFINHLPFNYLYLSLFLSVLLFLFSFFYCQIFYLSSIAFIKNPASLTSLVIALTMFIPVPLNFLTKNRDDFFDLFIFNPFVAIARVKAEDFFNLANISQLMLLVIAILALNVIVMSKQEEINRKYRL